MRQLFDKTYILGGDNKLLFKTLGAMTRGKRAFDVRLLFEEMRYLVLLYFQSKLSIFTSFSVKTEYHSIVI